MKKILIFISLVLIVFACGKGTDKKAQLTELLKQRDELNKKIETLQKEVSASDSSQIKKLDVTVEVLKPVEFNHFVEVQGRLDGDENIAVSPKTAGVINSILIKEGQQVRAGQVLLVLDAQVLRQSIEELKLQLDFATNIFNKQKNLWDKKIGSEIQFLTAKNNKESLEKKLSTLNDQLEMSSVKSPISGTVEELPIKIGQSVMPGLTVARVFNYNKMKLMADLAEAYSPKVHNGDEVIISFPDFNEEINTKLTFVSKYINPINRTFTVEAQLTQGNHEYRANMIAVIKINDYKSKNAITVPVNVIHESLDGFYVYVAKEENGKKSAVRKNIKPGMSYKGLTEVLSGLQENDKLITIGYHDLKEGQLINY